MCRSKLCFLFCLNRTDLGLVGLYGLNYSNPFNPTTTISFLNDENNNVELSIFNIKGQKITTLVKEQMSAGEHSVVWSGLDSNNKPVGSGIYFYKLIIDRKTEAIKKCLLLK